MILEDKSVLITGGTGSFGRAFTARALAEGARRVAIFSRDEFKQSEMARAFPDRRMRFCIGDVRDFDRLTMALKGVDIVVHAAALKQVPAGEMHPFEFVNTNVVGSHNVVRACLDVGVDRVVALSSDKACNPVNLYGTTKLVMEKLFCGGNVYVGAGPTRLSAVRYGNVAGSRGSVIPLFRRLAEKRQALPITDPEMTRFFLTLDQAVDLVITAICRMQGGEVFVPKIAACKITRLAKIIAPKGGQTIVGIRPGEKLHEELIPSAVSRLVFEHRDYYTIVPDTWAPTWIPSGMLVCSDFSYRSDNAKQMTDAEIKAMLEQVK